MKGIVNWRGRPYTGSVDDYMASRVDKVSDAPCWRWLGTIRPDGYGIVNIRPHTNRRAHRVAFEIARGPIPAGMTLDHLCRNRWCVNPAHLDPVTIAENVMRGDGVCARKARQTHCQNGHRLDLVVNERGHRQCSICRPEYIGRAKAVA